jgi:hypothetical protein
MARFAIHIGRHAYKFLVVYKTTPAHPHSTMQIRDLPERSPKTSLAQLTTKDEPGDA